MYCETQEGVELLAADRAHKLVVRMTWCNPLFGNVSGNEVLPGWYSTVNSTQSNYLIPFWFQQFFYALEAKFNSKLW